MIRAADIRDNTGYLGEQHVQAYFYLRMAIAKLEAAPQATTAFDDHPRSRPESLGERIELASIYFWSGNSEAAETQRQEVEKRNTALAEKLKELMGRQKVAPPTTHN